MQLLLLVVVAYHCFLNLVSSSSLLSFEQFVQLDLDLKRFAVLFWVSAVEGEPLLNQVVEVEEVCCLMVVAEEEVSCLMVVAEEEVSCLMVVAEEEVSFLKVEVEVVMPS